MGLEIYSYAILLVLFSGLVTSPNQILSNAQEPELALIGSTTTKQFYITRSNLTDDFARSLNFICPMYFSMALASVESDEEFQVIDSWFAETYGNSSNERAWTSAFKMGSVTFHWATNGQVADLRNYTLNTPWQAGGWNGASYSWNNCLSIYRQCNRPPGSPAGCWPSRTAFYYSDCREQNRIICQKAL